MSALDGVPMVEIRNWDLQKDDSNAITEELRVLVPALGKLGHAAVVTVFDHAVKRLTLYAVAHETFRPRPPEGRSGRSPRRAA